jgi:hypothetical protein
VVFLLGHLDPAGEDSMIFLEPVKYPPNNSVSHHRRYESSAAWLWEHQTSGKGLYNKDNNIGT